jgi:hypothetical protein
VVFFSLFFSFVLFEKYGQILSAFEVNQLLPKAWMLKKKYCAL